MNVRAKSPTRRSRLLNRKSPNRKSPTRRSPNRKSPNRKSPTRRSPTRRSPKRRSPKRGSPKRKSPTRRSPKRGSPKRGSPKRVSPKRRSPKRGSLKHKYRPVRRKSHNMLRGGTEDEGVCDKCKQFLKHEEGMNGLEPWIGKWIHKDRKVCGICDVCGEHLKEEDGAVGTGTNRIGWWIHNEMNKTLCSETLYNKQKAAKNAAKSAAKKAEKEKKELEKKAAEKPVAMKTYKDLIKYDQAIDIVKYEMEIENKRFNALSDFQQQNEQNGDFFTIPIPQTEEEEKIISQEKLNRSAYKDNQKKQTDKIIKDLQDLMTYEDSTDKVLIVYSVASINKTNPSWTKSNPYSIEIHCTTFRPENNANDPPQNFYGHVTLNIHRGVKSTGGIDTESYHYGIYNKDGEIKSFTRKFWSNNELIEKPDKPIFINDGINSEFEFLFPKISAGNLMIKYYNWCIRTCPARVMPFSLRNDTFQRLTRWGI